MKPEAKKIEMPKGLPYAGNYVEYTIKLLKYTAQVTSERNKLKERMGKLESLTDDDHTIEEWINVMTNRKEANYDLDKPKYFTGWTVLYKHHNGNEMVGKIIGLETHYGVKRDTEQHYGYHIYQIASETGNRGWWIGEKHIIKKL